jgi:hypothetical protein
MKKVLLYIFLFCTLITAKTFAQEIRVDTLRINKSRVIKLVSVMTVPKFILQLSANYNFGALELSGHNGGFSKEDFIEGKNYGARNGYGFSLIGKLPADKKGKFWIDALASFNRFQSNLIANNTEEGKSSYNVYSGGLGAEYNFTSYHRVKYFVGFNALFSSISAKATLVRTDKTSFDIKFNSAFRIGYSLFVGFDYAFEKDFGFNMGVKFTHANLLLKKSTVTSDSTISDFNDNSLSPPSLYAGWKQFAFLSVSAGISYYFSVRQNRYKLP